ncbi:hypothetical protein C0995_002303 [Termitomyces sp. Mi166|nr:hypothetical protein C0995_002303 [Termitomyces sp. Mi166\
MDKADKVQVYLWDWIFKGDLVFLHGLGMNILVLNSPEVIDDLFEKCPLIYSDRPSLIVVGELMGLNQIPACYGEEWHEHRRMMHSVLSQSAMKHHSRQEDFSALLSLSLLDNPADYITHVRLTAARLALSVTYGLTIDEAGRDYIKHAEETMALVKKVAVPGAYLAEFLSVLKYLPSCVRFHRHAARGRAMIDYLLTMPFEYVKQLMELGTAPSSLVKDLLLQNMGDDSATYAHENRVKWIAGTNYSAGSETISTIVLTFILAMALYPDKQKLAQDEIDLVIGTERLPTITDRESCPYVGALIKETLRWRPTLPLGIMRCTSEDAEYRGYFIPKGTIVVPNSWVLAFEPNEKYDPQLFIPERFLDPDPVNAVTDSGVWAFGYGRRVCPGKSLAENSLAVLIPTILAAFDILPPEDGVVEPKHGLDLYSYPESFKCRIVPRSTKAAELVRKRAAVANV